MSKSRNNALEFSSVGSVIINAAEGATSGNFGAIQFLQDSEIEDIAGDSIANIGLLETTLPAGTILYGKFTTVEIASGLVALHKV